MQYANTLTTEFLNHPASSSSIYKIPFYLQILSTKSHYLVFPEPNKSQKH